GDRGNRNSDTNGNAHYYHCKYFYPHPDTDIDGNAHTHKNGHSDRNIVSNTNRNAHRLKLLHCRHWCIADTSTPKTCSYSSGFIHDGIARNGKRSLRL
ncbi:MAG: hypothetical protein KC940_05630, partial [Candidatus Omnitrophica bacterium]|nr:hypothetical protein [Candidatus Omnitrophota bacterium]